jgi:hypothetical protein
VTDIFREIDEDLRRDRLEAVWRRYGTYILAAAVAVVVATGAYVGWQRYAESARAGRAAAFVGAMDLVARKDAGAEAALASIASEGGGYAALARLQQAAQLAKAGDVAGATDIYEAMTGDGSLEAPFRDLALILIGLRGVDTAEPVALSARLAPLAEDGQPWRHSARELMALLAQRAGDTAKARELLNRLVDDQEAPQGARRRATELLQGLPE